MNNAEQKKINWPRLLRPIAIALVLIFLLSSATYAWLKRDWTPTVQQENIKIVAGSSLTFVFDGEEKDNVNINELLGESDFSFKSVSNATGYSDDFFTLMYSPLGEYYDTFKKISLSDLPESLQNVNTKYTELGKKYRYVDLTFSVKSAVEGTVHNQAVYLDSTSRISAATTYYEDGVEKSYTPEQIALHEKAAQAIRVSVTVYGTEGNVVRHTIFAKDTTVHTGVSPEQADGVGYIANEALRYKAEGDSFVPAETVIWKTADGKDTEFYLKETHADVKSFDDFASEPLFVLGKGEMRTVTIRIWLEGEDSHCNDEIAGSALDLLMKFKAENVINS